MSNVPKLRFKEFGGEWEEKRLSEVSNIIGGGTPETAIEEYWNGDIQWFTPTEIKSDYVSNSLRTISELGLKKSSAKILPIGTILLTTRATIGEVSIALRECTTNQGFQSLIVKDDYINIFIFNWIKNNKYKFTSKANGSTFPEISKSEIEKIKIKIPSKPEQEKIASFLTSVDTKIEQLTKKEALLKEYKKGLMNKIFNQEIRFKDDDGSEFPEWEEKTLNELVTFKNGKAHENDIVDNGKYIVVNSKFISSDGQKAKYSDSQITPLFKNDIVMVMSDVPNGKALAKCFFIEEDDKYSLNQRICALKQTSNNNKFLIYLINRNKYYLSFDSGVGQTNLKRNEVLDLILNMPCIQEQTKIANFLSSIDNKIEQTTKQLNSTKEFKKALLQQMFV